ncbi:TetR/AcrR family transcriptional regulator [Acetobacterium tundrae]|uniref:TetR family transcriptional regulator n=1 Tax=Acetobacterium tundrae TaxID=132932 RepID=A0ABR6WPS3_9FIRM|nr:TetR/AcrR family transcriptional regulator [Acetobacterium tundrae]MBC3798145.1 TetR family transcriptional regulator [Acetobacterium tundrae]
MKKDVKNEIIEATIKLIEEKGSNPEDITIRDICERVGIGAGLVNYHYQTKENLIKQCVQKIISEVINKTKGVYDSLSDMTPEEKLRYMAKYTCTYLEAHENISRMSILTDLTGVNQNDNTAQTAVAYFPLLRQACREDINDQEVKRRTCFMLMTLQSAFLRSPLLYDEIGIDFHNQKQRDDLVDMVINFYLKN